MYLPEDGMVEEFVKSLNAEGVEAGGIYNKGIPDWHIYIHWKMLMEKMISTKEGCPFSCPLYKGPVPEYTEDMCPNTLNWLSRSVHIDIPPQLSKEDCIQIAAGIEKVASVCL